MTMRHIRPGSMEWREVMEDEGETLPRLEPEQMQKLRHILAMERTTLGMPPVDVLHPISARHAPSH